MADPMIIHPAPGIVISYPTPGVSADDGTEPARNDDALVAIAREHGMFALDAPAANDIGTGGGIPPLQALPGQDFAHWWRAVRETAPLAPTWFCNAVTHVLTAPAMNADALLIVADALDEAGDIAVIEGLGRLSSQLKDLADLPRDLAPKRAAGEA